MFQQDRALAHCAREMEAFLARQTPQSVTPDLRPPNSPDLNPVDYKVWSVIQDRVYQMSIHDVDDLKHRLMAAWSGCISQSSMIDQWSKRLHACVKANGRHFEHLL